MNLFIYYNLLVILIAFISMILIRGLKNNVAHFRYIQLNIVLYIEASPQVLMKENKPHQSLTSISFYNSMQFNTVMTINCFPPSK